jgi:hypothetical protein
MPFDVVAQRVIEDLRHRVPLMAVQVLGLAHVDSSRASLSGRQPAAPILTLVAVRKGPGYTARW